MGRWCCVWLVFLVSACQDNGGSSGIDVTADLAQTQDVVTEDIWHGPAAPEYRELTGYVDPMIGTNGAGNSIPGAQVPHGVVKLSPDSVKDEGLMEYEWDDPGRIFGFSHTHLQGPGGSGYGYNQLLVYPMVDRRGDAQGDLSSAIDHATESAAPGYYAVRFEDPGVDAEVTATRLTGLHRYTFPASSEAEIRIDLSHTGGKCVEASIEFVPPDTVTGSATYNVFPLYAAWGADQWGITGQRTLHFYGKFSQDYIYHDSWSAGEVTADRVAVSGIDTGAIAGFIADPETPVLFKVGLSLISREQAQANLVDELPGWDFDVVRFQAEELWNTALNQVIVDGDEADLQVFYSALYRSMVEPVDYTEGDRAWIGPGGAGQVVDLEGRHFYADDWCLWDTFRTSHPLRTLLEPEMCGDLAESYLRAYDQGGWLPKCPWQATGYSRMMIGNHAIPVLSDFISKGLDDFDVEKAYVAMRKAQTQESIEAKDWPGMCGYVNLGTPPEYISNGYVSQNCDEHQSVSMTLEYAFDDWCLAQVATRLGKVADATIFGKRAMNYLNHWDEETGFLRPRMVNGAWLSPFDPESGDGFCEADAWKYLWFVPHDIPGLIELMGGSDLFLQRLDAFFEGDHYTADNQPDFHVPYLYNSAGRPWQTQELVTRLLKTEFGPGPDGLPGNDDAGSTSAWYLFGAMGFYPVNPAGGTYELTAPLFDRVVIRLHETLHPGDAFVIDVSDRHPDHPYIVAARLNGQPLTRSWLSHDELVRGGTLELTMGATTGLWPAPR